MTVVNLLAVRSLVASSLLAIAIVVTPGTPFVMQSGADVASARTASIIPWNVAGTIRRPGDICFWDGLDWDEMSEAEQWAWSRIGWTEEMWDGENDLYPATDALLWVQLTSEQQTILVMMGFNPATWEDSNC